MEKLKIEIVNKQDNGGSKSPSNCNPCDSNKFFNSDYYAFVTVQTLKERDNIPCALRQNGMIAVVVEENFRAYQIQESINISKCNNLSWKLYSTGGSIEEPITESFRVTAPAGNMEYGSIFPGGLTLSQALIKLLTKVELAKIIDSGSITLTKDISSSTFEVGSTITLKLTVSTNKGIVKGSYLNDIWDKDLEVSYRGNPIKYSFLNTVNQEVLPVTPTTNNATISFIGVMGNNILKGFTTFSSNEFFTSSENLEKTIVAEEILQNNLVVTCIQRRFVGPINTIPSSGDTIRTSLLNTSLLSTSNNMTLNTGIVNKNFIIAIENSKTLSKVVNSNTNADVTSGFVLSNITTIPDANGDSQTYKVYIMTNTVPFSSNQVFNITLK